MIGFRSMRRLTKAALLFTLAVACIATLASAACGRAERAERAPLVHDAYIWQRQWTPSLDRAVEASASRVRVWRVLAAELDARGQITESKPHLDVLTRSARPVIPVIRISGRVSEWDELSLIRLGQALVQGGTPASACPAWKSITTARRPACADTPPFSRRSERACGRHTLAAV